MMEINWLYTAFLCPFLFTHSLPLQLFLFLKPQPDLYIEAQLQKGPQV